MDKFIPQLLSFLMRNSPTANIMHFSKLFIKTKHVTNRQTNRCHVQEGDSKDIRLLAQLLLGK